VPVAIKIWDNGGMAISAETKRIQRQRVVDLMIRIYCTGNGHARPEPGQQLCSQCGELADYARRRNDACPLLDERSFCQFCPVHCYKPAMRERITQVMRYAGPRMIFHRPIVAFRHLVELRRHRHQQRHHHRH
jgi:hypothetical protein